MTAAAAFVVLAFAGLFGVAAIGRARGRRRKPATTADKPIRFKSILAGADTPFRANANEVYEEPAGRAAEPATLDRVLTALRDGGLVPRLMLRGFEIPGSKPDTYLRVTVRDAARVEPDTMAITHTEGELAIAVAFALVPVFGPIGIDMGAAAWLVVDGSRDVASIRKELGARYAVLLQQMIEAMAPLQDMMAQLSAKLKPPDR